VFAVFFPWAESAWPPAGFPRCRGAHRIDP
jgi:hypothetical protein